MCGHASSPTLIDRSPCDVEKDRAAGQYAIGGGFSQDASTGTDGKYDLGGKADVQITVSAPYFAGEYEPVDEAGNFRADQWVVRGFNHSASQVDVRAWVVCADVS